MVETKQCPDCGAALPAGAPEGLCPRCLLRGGLRSSKDTPVRSGVVSTQPSLGPAPAPEPAELAPHFPQFEILELLGQGGMGAVYKARQFKLDRLVALKVLSAEASRDAAFAERFMREARALARLNHPHVVTVHDFGEAGGLFYFLMEYVDGLSLRHSLQAGRLDVAQTLHVIPQVCDALQYAHEEGIVHRDIKPENILLDQKGRVKIADFGLAKLVGLTPTYLTLTGSHQVMGTLYYMAPEQMERSHAVDHRADIYSLGVVFYEMLTGELPLGRFAPPSHKAPVAEAFDAVVLRALAKEPEGRFQRVSEMKEAVAALPAGGVSAAAPTPAAGAAAFLSVAFSSKQKVNGETVSVQGVARLEENCLALEYTVAASSQSSQELLIQEKRIAFGDIASIGVESSNKTRLVFTVTRLSLLTGLPGGEGKVKLAISEHDKRRAKQMADLVMRKKFDHLAGRVVGAPPRASASLQEMYLDLVRVNAKGPAGGLLVTGVVTGIAWAIMLSAFPVPIYVTGGGRYGFDRELVGHGALGKAYPGLIPLMVIPTALLVFGAWCLRNLRGYEFAMAACILALIPWSPAFPLGIVMGIWGIVFLTRPEVKAAFAHRLNPRSPILPPLPPPPDSTMQRPRGGVFGRVRSFVYSVGNYCFSLPGRRSYAEGPTTVPGEKTGESGTGREG